MKVDVTECIQSVCLTVIILAAIYGLYACDKQERQVEVQRIEKVGK